MNLLITIRTLRNMWMMLYFLRVVGEWDNACNELQKMLIVRSLRPDRVSFCVTTFIINNLGSQYVEPPVLDIQQVVDDSSTKTPLIFVLSPGVVSIIVAIVVGVLVFTNISVSLCLSLGHLYW